MSSHRFGSRSALLLAGCLLLMMFLGLESPDISADNAPAIAERPQRPEKFLNPLVDMIRAKRETEARIQKALEKIVSVEFQKVRFEQAMNQFADAAGVNIWIDDPALKEEGVSRHDRVSFSTKGLTLHQALREILEPLGLDYVIRNEVLKLTTRIATEEMLENRYYEVGDLLEWEESHHFEPRAMPRSALSTLHPHTWLQETIQFETSGPWIDTEGIGGELHYQGRVMMIRQTQRVHNEIAPILKMFRLFIANKFGKDQSVFLDSLSDLDGDLRVRQALAKRVTLSFDETPLKDVAAHLAKELEIPIRLDMQALTEEGVDETQPISLRIKEVTLQTALELMLDRHGLEAVIYNGTLVFTTMIAAEEKQMTAAYDVRDLIRDGAVHPSFFPQQIWNETFGPWEDVDGTGGVISEPLPGLLLIQQTKRVQEEVVKFFDEQRERTKERKAKGLPPQVRLDIPKPDDLVTEFYQLHTTAEAEEIKQAVEDVVEPKTWDHKGGEGKIAIIKNYLVVKNTAKVHREVYKFLVRVSAILEKESREKFWSGGLTSPSE